MGPGNASCLCAEGWTGDGQVCVEINNCQLETRGGCSANADCNHVGPGQVSQSPWWMMLWPVINKGVSVDKLPTVFINPFCFYTLHDASLLWEFFLFSNVFTLCFCVCVPACLRCSTRVCVKKASWEMERSVTASTPAPSTMEAATSWWEHITLTVCLHVSLAYPLIHSWNSGFINRFLLPRLVISDTCCQNSLCTTRLQRELIAWRSLSKSTSASYVLFVGWNFIFRFYT